MTTDTPKPGGKATAMRDMTKFGAVLALWLTAGAAAAQDAWVQIEAQPGLGRAEQAAAGYATRLPDVAGFRLGGSNWYAVALGPYSDAQAQSVRSQLRASGSIPFDAFVSDGATYRQQFWPPAGAEASPETALPTTPTAETPVQTRDADQTVAEAARTSVS